MPSFDCGSFWTLILCGSLDNSGLAGGCLSVRFDASTPACFWRKHLNYSNFHQLRLILKVGMFGPEPWRGLGVHKLSKIVYGMCGSAHIPPGDNVLSFHPLQIDTQKVFSVTPQKLRTAAIEKWGRWWNRLWHLLGSTPGPLSYTRTLEEELWVKEQSSFPIILHLHLGKLSLVF